MARSPSETMPATCPASTTGSRRTAFSRISREAADGIERLGAWLAAAPAKLAGLAGRKGVLAPGADADIVVFDPDAAWTVTPDQLHFRHKLSPYLGAELRGRVEQTWLRGRQVFSRNGFASEARGRELVRA